MFKTTMKIEGMMCGMCEAHICDAIRKAVPSAKKVAASRSKKEASFLTEAPVDANLLKSAANMTGYTCLSVDSVPYEKKGLFGRKTRMFAGDPAPFVMELPAYHLPAWSNVLRGTWERGWSFI